MNSRAPANPQANRRHYDANYGNFASDLYTAIRREAFGEDIGQNSWLTATEQDGFIPLLNLGPGKTLLDIACGSGGPALRIAQKTGCSLVGIDAHPEGIAAATSQTKERGLRERAQFHLGDASLELAFPNANFHAITCIDSINHFPDHARVLSDWFRLLRPGGRLVFTNASVVTGPLAAAEIATRSTGGSFFLVPEGYHEAVLRGCGFVVLAAENRSTATAEVAQGRFDARAVRSAALTEIEGADAFSQQQEFLTVASRLAREGRLSRFLYLAEKPLGAEEPLGTRPEGHSF